MKILDGKEGRKRLTNCQTEANDKVWALNQKAEQALDTLVVLYERSCQHLFIVVPRDWCRRVRAGRNNTDAGRASLHKYPLSFLTHLITDTRAH